MPVPTAGRKPCSLTRGGRNTLVAGPKESVIFLGER